MGPPPPHPPPPSPPPGVAMGLVGWGVAMGLEVEATGSGVAMGKEAGAMVGVAMAAGWVAEMAAAVTAAVESVH